MMTTGANAAGELVAEALRRKAAAVGEYSYRDLGRESGVHWTHADQVIRGRRRATPAILRAWAEALAPFLSYEAVMVAAGYVPEGESGELVRRFLRLPWAERLALLEQAVHD